MKKLTFALVVFAIGLALYSAPNIRIALAQDCQRSACRSGDKYNADNQRCESGPSGLGYRSHYEPSCPAGYDLDRTKGMCVQHGECCLKRACKTGYQFRNGRCNSKPSVLGYRTHYFPDCGAGWDLDAATGMCRKTGCGESDAQIERLGPNPCVDRGGTVTIYGSNFGPQQGTRVVELGGHGIGVLLRVTSWSDTQITAIVPNDRRIEFGQWYYIGLQNQERQWITNISRTINVCREIG